MEQNIIIEQPQTQRQAQGGGIAFEGGSPLPAEALVEMYFLEARNALLQIASFFDRAQRAAGGREAVANHPRCRDIRDGCALAAAGPEAGPDRVRQILERLSAGGEGGAT